MRYPRPPRPVRIRAAIGTNRHQVLVRLSDASRARLIRCGERYTEKHPGRKPADGLIFSAGLQALEDALNEGRPFPILPV